MHRTLSSTAALAVTAMIDLAQKSQAGPVALAVIAHCQGISTSYTDQLFGKLRRHALVRATRGPGGGYTLGRDAKEITVADIVVAVERARVPRSRRLSSEVEVLDIWNELDAKLMEWFEAIPLQALLCDRAAPAEGAAQTALATGAIASRPEARILNPGIPNSVFALAAALPVRSRWAR